MYVANNIKINQEVFHMHVSSRERGTDGVDWGPKTETSLRRVVISLFMLTVDPDPEGMIQLWDTMNI